MNHAGDAGRQPTDQLHRLRARLNSAEPATESQTANDPPITAAASSNSPYELIVAVLDATGAEYEVDDGDVYGRWERGLFQFSQLGDAHEPIVQVHGTWERVLPEDSYPRAALFCNDWNAANAWPKAYAQVDEDHRLVGIFGETTVDLAAGASIEQTEVIVHQGIGTALQLFDAAAEAFPDADSIE